MATLKAIRRRIASTTSTKKLTHAMKMISSSRLRRAGQRVMDARLFNKEISRILSEIIKRGHDINNPLLTAKTEKRGMIDLIIFTSDRGLCGPFNENLLKQALSFILKKRDEGILVRCHVIGKKGRDFFKRHNMPIERSFSEDTLFNEAASGIERYLNNDSDEVIMLFNRFRGGGGAEISFQTLLPAAGPDAVRAFGIDYIYEPKRAEVVNWAVNQMIRSNFYLAYLESSASELAARMVTMDKATKNADDLIALLAKQYNRARQAAITKELIDIVGGAEALK